MPWVLVKEYTGFLELMKFLWVQFVFLLRSERGHSGFGLDFFYCIPD